MKQNGCTLDAFNLMLTKSRVPGIAEDLNVWTCKKAKYLHLLLSSDLKTSCNRLV